MPSDISLADDNVTTTPDDPPLSHQQAAEMLGKTEPDIGFKMKKLQMMEALKKESQQM